ncbi:CpaD family pilus assembly lipoprotein [Sphingobium subterraneum]|uniref:Pilus assembly protein CpaD n=1 Tax=Sphingobium subterraneum TaxID=627688 RepID=A0A841J298_9SPHN|nr:CpaD family pilus assembly lipoprotein [Sphingobium subterraneum]MBB6124790.1 pilus assembly protein CpaD [Sphingobium subterraneum]
MQSTSPLFRPLSLAALLLAAMPMTVAAKENPFNRSVDSVHQPVVQFQYYLYDVQANDGSTLSAGERARLLGWLDSLNVGYGDHVAIATDDAFIAPNVRDGIADILGGRGMLIEEDPTAQAGKAPPGAVRLIMRRSIASVPGCPNWNSKQENDVVGGASSNYGCASNSNLAAMVANPEDLVRGKTATSDLRTAASSRAIETYRTKPLTGAGALQTLTGN